MPASPRVVGQAVLTSRPIACRGRLFRVEMPSPGRYADTTSSAQPSLGSKDILLSSLAGRSEGIVRTGIISRAFPVDA